MHNKKPLRISQRLVFSKFSISFFFFLFFRSGLINILFLLLIGSSIYVLNVSKTILVNFIPPLLLTGSYLKIVF